MDTPIFYATNVSFNSGTDRAEIQANIDAIKAIISALLTQVLVAVQAGNVVMYELDTGQTRTKTQFSDPATLRKMVKEWEETRQMYENMLAPSRVRMVDSRNFRT